MGDAHRIERAAPAPATTVGQPLDRTSDQRFDAFFELEATGQVRRATLLLGSVDEANDVVQEAFVRIYRAWSTIENPGPYLNRTVLNLCRDHARKGTTNRSLIRKLTSAITTSTPTADREVLSDVLATLPFNHRAAIVLRYWGGLTTDEIAAELDCATGSVGPWIDRGLTSIRKALT